MNTTLIVPAASPAAAPSGACGCGPIHAVWVPSNDIVLATSIPGDSHFAYTIVAGGSVPEGTAWEANGSWTPTGSGEGSQPAFAGNLGSGPTLTPWELVYVYGGSPPGILAITVTARCPSGKSLSTQLTMIVGSGGYGSGSG